MRRKLLMIAMIGAVAGAVRAEPPAAGPPVIGRAEQCLREHADRVVADDPDLKSAADFLITYACAPEVSAAARYERNLVAAQHFNNLDRINPYGLSETAPKGAPPPQLLTMTVDPETGDLMPPKTSGGAQSDALNREMASNLGDQTAFFGDVTPVELRELAGQLVLASYERQHPR